jgi:hypothetical protein
VRVCCGGLDDKGSFVLVGLPMIALALWLCVRRLEWRKGIIAGAAATLAFAIIVAPQIYVSVSRFGSWFPYPNSQILSKQLAWGSTMWHYATTVTTDGTTKLKFAGRRYLTPYEAAVPENYAGYLIENPRIAIALFGGHLVGAFDYTQLKTYVTDPEIETFSPTNLVVGFAIFACLMLWLRRLMERTYDVSDFFLDAIFFGVVAVLPLLAVGTRFSLLPMIVIFLRLISWTTLPLPAGSRVPEVFGGVLFAFLFATCAAVIAGTAFY